MDKEEMVFPDYTDSIANFACSIQKYYGIQPAHKTIPEVDSILARNYQHVVVILLDGMGMNVLEHHLGFNDFLRRNLLKEYSSVFPPTTVASTTSFLTGKYPIEHGWLGWDMFFEKEDKTVTCFTNNIQFTDTPAADYNVVRKYFNYESIVEQINKTGRAEADIIFPFGPEGHPDFSDWTSAIKKSCKKKKRTFTYAYWENPDFLLHKNGVDNSVIEKNMRELNSNLLYLCSELKDTLVFITADHGHKNINSTYLVEEYPELANMLERPISIEPRAASFYVKSEYKEKFPELFNKCFGEDYVLYSKNEVIQNQLFGPGFPHLESTGIGDYIGVSVTDKTIFWSKETGKKFKSHHSGLTKEEMRIPLIWKENRTGKTGMIVYYTIVGLLIAFLLYIIF